MIRILLVDDQNIVRQGIQALLESRPRLKVVGTAEDGNSAIEQVEILRPDVVLIDIEMPVMSGITATHKICQQFPTTKVLVLSSHEDREYVAEALRAGAEGYLLKNTLAEDLEQAIWSVYRGQSQIESKLLKEVLASASASSSITSVEKNGSTLVGKKPVQETSLKLHGDSKGVLVSNVNNTNDKCLPKIGESTQSVERRQRAEGRGQTDHLAGDSLPSAGGEAPDCQLRQALDANASPHTTSAFQGKSLGKNGSPSKISKKIHQPACSQPKSIPRTKNKYRSGIKWLAWSGIIGLFTVGGWFGYSYYIQHTAEPIAVKSLSAQKGTVENTVSESGTVEYGEQRTLKSPGENLTVEQVKVAEGDRVSAGETLILLRDREAEEQERDRVAENAQQEVTLARNLQKVSEARQKLIHQETELTKLKEPFQLGAVAESVFLEEQRQLVEAQAELRDTRAEVKKAELDVGKGQDKLRAIQQLLKDRLVNAPIDGVVLDVQAEDGDGITTDTELLTLGDKSEERVTLRLTTLNAAKIRLNQVARVSEIGPNPKTFTGRVISLHPAATAEDEQEGGLSNPFGQQSDNQNKVDTTILLDRPSQTLIPGSQVDVEIVQQQRQEVVTLPIEALQRTGTQPFVWVEDGQGRAKKQPVTSGLEGLELVEVTSGLKAGERIILPPSTGTLAPDTPVKIVDDTLPQKQVQ